MLYKHNIHCTELFINHFNGPGEHNWLNVCLCVWAITFVLSILYDGYVGLIWVKFKGQMSEFKVTGHKLLQHWSV